MTQMTIDQALDLGRQHHQAGRLTDAEVIYRQVLAAQPNHAEATHLFGVLVFQAGHVAPALALLRRAVALNPGASSYRANLAQALNTTGDQLDTMGRLDEAIAAFREAIAAQPDFADAHNNLGVSLQKQGQVDLAVAAFREALRHRPDFPQPMYNLGELLRACGEFDEATPLLQQAMRLWPTSADVHYSLGRSLHAQDRFSEAVIFFARAVELKPGFADAENYLGIALSATERLLEAIDAFKRAIAIQPGFPEAFSNLGSALQSSGQLDEAIAACTQAIAQKPDFTNAWRNLGIASLEKGLVKEAIAAHRQAIQIDPKFAEGHNSLASALHAAGEYETAIAEFREAIALKPDFVLAHYNLGILLLLIGQFGQGWPEYEWRDRDPEVRRAYQDFVEPKWDGSDLKGSKILVYAEQGFGDTLQFVRYIPMLAERSASVILQVQPETLKIVSSVAGVSRLIARGDAIGEFDVRCSLLSLPMLLGTRAATIPASIPYLHSDAALAGCWREHLQRDKFKVGLVWAGGAAHSNDRNRSMSLRALAPLAEVAGVQWVSLQKGPAAAQAQDAASVLHVLDCSNELDDFAVTASLIDNLDLVITVDTAVAHLAGALGKRVWVMLPFVPDWRWMLGRTDSPWYPRMRFFRQTSIGDWTAPVMEIAAALRELNQG